MRSGARTEVEQGLTAFDWHFDICEILMLTGEGECSF
jgi:hypothetical protein